MPRRPNLDRLTIGAPSLIDAPGLVVLAGCARPRGRYGLIGVASEVEGVHSFSALERALRPDPGLIHVALLDYELGYECVGLPAPTPPQAQVFHLESALWLDYVGPSLATFGSLSQPLRALLSRSPAQPPPPGSATLRPLVSDALHAQRVAALQDHISRGDIYQANLSRPLALDGQVTAEGLFAKLCTRNPVEHGAFLRWDEGTLVSNSMETLIRKEGDIVASYPIKGTIPSGAGSSQLLRDPKERAEHVMIVDLVRNDLGKFCIPGSVCVPDLMAVERFHGVRHGVSRVVGQPRPGTSFCDMLRALFPGGSITGAPKRRAMELIYEQEREPRGYYTGAIALVTPEFFSVSILIRTAVRTVDGWRLQVGGGIVADSVATRELDETWHKVRVFEDALSEEVRRTLPRRRAPRPARAAP